MSNFASSSSAAIDKLPNTKNLIEYINAKQWPNPTSHKYIPFQKKGAKS